jgi:hypothetical protein
MHFSKPAPSRPKQPPAWDMIGLLGLMIVVASAALVVAIVAWLWPHVK